MECFNITQAALALTGKTIFSIPECHFYFCLVFSCAVSIFLCL